MVSKGKTGWLGELKCVQWVISDSWLVIWVGNANTSESLGFAIILKNKTQMLSHEFHLLLCPF